MANLKDKLVQPFFFIDFDDETRFRVRMAQADVDRIAKEFKPLSDRIMEHPERLKASDLKKAYEVIAGKKTGDEIYETALAYVKGGETDISDDDCVTPLVSVFVELAERAQKQMELLDLSKQARYARYLGQEQKPL